MNKLNFLHSFVFGAIYFISTSQAFAATEIELVNERTRKGKTHAFTVKILSDGEKAHYSFHTNYDSKIVSGSYLLSLDGGETAYFVSRGEEGDEKECHQWTNQEIVQQLGKVLLEATKKFNVDVSNPVVTKVFEHDAEDMLGFSVKHIRVNASFDASYKFLIIRGQMRVERQLDAWMTSRLEGIKTKPIFQRIWQSSGYPPIDLALKEVPKLLPGYLLRSEITQTEFNIKKDKKTTTRIIQHVKSIKKIEKLPQGIFDIPACENIGTSEMQEKFVYLLSVLAGKPL